MWRFQVDYNQAGAATWRLYASNHAMVAWAGESFSSLTSARRAAAAFKVGAGTARYDVYQDLSGAWRWRAWRGSDKVASSGESFSSHFAAERAATNVRDNAGGAVGLAAA